METDLSSIRIPSPVKKIPNPEWTTTQDVTGADRSTAATTTSARPWSYASPPLRKSITPTLSPATQRISSSFRYQEADIGDTLRPLKHVSSSSLLLLSKSSSEPNLVEDKKQPSKRISDSLPSAGLDITENGTHNMLRLDPADLARFRKWVIGFCIVNFDLEIGQGKFPTTGQFK